MLTAAVWICALAQRDLQAEFQRRMAPFLETHCAKCHTGADAEGEFEFSGFLDGSRGFEDLRIWSDVLRQLDTRAMPPKKEPRPAQAQVDAATAWIEALLAERGPPSDPGRTTLRRLNRIEYQNSVRALLGVEFDASATFPPDDVGFGFDNIGDVLSMSDTLFEKYVLAAERIAELAIDIPDPRFPRTTRIPDAIVVHTEKFATQGGAWSLYTNGFIGVDFAFAREGEYILRARAFGQQAGAEPARMAFKLGDEEVARFDVLATSASPQTYEMRLAVDAGTRRFEAWFVNDFWNPDEPDRRKRDRNLSIEWLEIAGPIGTVQPTEFQLRCLPADGNAAAADVIRHVAERAWRRPLGAEELDSLAGLAPDGASRDSVVRDALIAILSSPHFLFRVEADPLEAPPGSARDLGPFELATRLSYFLWSTLPDPTTQELARSGELIRPDALASEVRRMLRDPRASEFVRNFAGQWLQLRTLERARPDPARFPGFDDPLRDAMRLETELLFEAVLREERGVSDLLDPDFTFLNERLAAHYGLAGVAGDAMRRVSLDANQRAARGGLLQQASVLTVTSNPTRTSPVKRGKWVLETLLGSPPLAPEPGVDSLDETPEATQAASLRERLARHRADVKCAVCHDTLDPLGFALENYDPVGRWRDEADGFAVDASGEFEDGTSFVGSSALERHIIADPRFVRCLLEKLAVYALGRGLRPQDQGALQTMARSFAGGDPTLTELILAVVQSDVFRRTVVASRP